MFRKIINSILFLPLALFINPQNVLGGETKDHIDNVVEEKSDKLFISANNITGGSAGQLLYQSAADTTAKLSVGGSSQVLVGGSTPSWTNISSLSVSSAATLSTARNINGVSFNGSGNITVNPTSGAYSNGWGAKTVSTGNPSGGSNGDIWYKY